MPSLLRIVGVAFDDAPVSIGSRTSVAFTVRENERWVTIGFEGKWPGFNAVCNAWRARRPMDIQFSGTASENALLLLDLIEDEAFGPECRIGFQVIAGMQYDPVFETIRHAHEQYAAKLFLSKWAGAAVGASKLFSVEEQVYLHGPFTDLAAVKTHPCAGTSSQ